MYDGTAIEIQLDFFFFLSCLLYNVTQFDIYLRYNVACCCVWADVKAFLYYNIESLKLLELLISY